MQITILRKAAVVSFGNPGASRSQIYTPNVRFGSEAAIDERLGGGRLLPYI